MLIGYLAGTRVHHEPALLACDVERLNDIRIGVVSRIFRCVVSPMLCRDAGNWDSCWNSIRNRAALW